MPASVPPLKQWNTFAGGAGAEEGRYSYSCETRHGEYHIIPVRSRGGRHIGYDLRFAATKFAPVTKFGNTWTRHSGLWHELGAFKTPAMAVKAARDFEKVSFVGV